jgi:hypothetical protein
MSRIGGNMSYKRTQWVNDETKLNADNLNNIEEGIVEATDSASRANEAAGTAHERANQAIQQLAQDKEALTLLIKALEQGIKDGTITVGAVEGNVHLESTEEELISLKINNEVYSFPSIDLEFSDEAIDNAYDLNSITIGGNSWNIPKKITPVTLSSDPVEGGYELKSITINGEAWNIVCKSKQYKAGNGIAISEDGTISLDLPDGDLEAY